MKRLTVTAFGLAWALHASAAPFSLDTTPGRLPKDVVPLDYSIDLSPDAQSLTTRGRETVLVEVRKSTGTIQFDSLNERLTDVRFDGKPVAATVSDDASQLTTVTLASPAAPGRHRLSFAFTGRIERGGAQGLFAQSYHLADGTTGVMLTTQFESTDARRMFPCWDEPAFRASFGLTVTAPREWTAVSNMPVVRRSVTGPLATTRFARTPRMSSYLVELTVGNLGHISLSSGRLQLNLWAVRGQEAAGRWSLENTRDIVADYGEYFGYPFPLPKLDAIAIPGGWDGAMENWGAITYNDQLLLESPSSTLADRQEMFDTQAHELSHQWFGDLVTLAWWDEMWLNESMTFWLDHSETARRHPEWHWWERADREKETAMRMDAQANSEAIHVHVTDEQAAAGAYNQDMISGKGQTMLRMIEAYVGPARFRAGLQSYMKRRALSNATSTDLWDALSAAAGTDLAALAGPWAEQPGFPLVSVDSDCDPSGARTLRLSQRRFLLEGEGEAALHWSVPLRIRSGADGAARSELLTRDGQRVAAGRCGEPLSINADALGFFRVRYDAGTLAANTAALSRLPVGDLIVLLDDEWALVEAQRTGFNDYLALARAMGDRLEARPWQQIAASLSAVEKAERGRPGHAAFVATASRILAGPFSRLGWDDRPGETPDVADLRRTLIGMLGAWGDPQVLAEARRRYAAFLADRHSVAPDAQRVLLSVIAHHADAATFDQLHALARSATDGAEQQRYYLALMSVDDDQLAAQAAAIAVSDELPPQASLLRSFMMAELATEHARVTWPVYTANAARFMEGLGAEAGPLLAQYTPTTFAREVPLADIEAWVRQQVPADLNPVVERGLEAARLDLLVRDRLRRAVEAPTA